MAASVSSESLQRLDSPFAQLFRANILDHCDLLLQASKIRCLNRAACASLPLAIIKQAMEQWLLSEEPSKRKRSKPQRSTKKKLSLRTIFRAFKGSVTQRGFLREMQQKHNAVVAGSYATALYLSRTHGSVTWSPHDIDLWIASSHDECNPCEKMATKFAEWIAAFDQPRGAYDLTEYKGYEGYPDSEDAFTPKEPSVLRADIQRWLQENFDKSYQNQLKKVPEQILCCRKERAYEIVATAKIVPHRLQWRKINVICVTRSDMRDKRPFGQMICEPFGQMICEGFDLSCCCAEMMISEDLNAIVRLHSDADDADEDMITYKIRLQPSCFTAYNGSIFMQMSRIAKYLKRGFRFPDP